MATETRRSFLERAVHREFGAWLRASDLGPTLEKITPFVMPPVSVDALTDLANIVRVVLACNIPGQLVECGVWRGGTGFLMADLLRNAAVPGRKVWLFDSFEGMPPVEAIDGAAAITEANDPDSPLHVENSRAPLEEVRRSAQELGLHSYTEFVKGWFSQTLPATRDRIGPIAILHIDCDWYSSVRCCLDNLYEQVAEGGFIVFDDYYHYDGCAIAVHEFLGSHRLPYRIESVQGEWGGCEYSYAARLCKGETNWKWGYLLYLASQDIGAVIPPKEAFILIGEELFGTEITAGRRTVPFLERGGQYWGRPPDDETATKELERLRRSGAGFVVFAWTAFWWFEQYPGFQHYLRSNYSQILANDRLVVFDLQR